MASTQAIILVSFAALWGSLGPVFFKKGASNLTRKDIFSNIYNGYLWIGVFFYATSSIIFIYALKGQELSILYPIVSSTYVWVSIWSMIFFREKMNKWKWLGVTLIISGVTLLGFGA
ncbi:MAG: EamA family transporter [Candidatus Woesearchaeota archaeon]